MVLGNTISRRDHFRDLDVDGLFFLTLQCWIQAISNYFTAMKSVTELVNGFCISVGKSKGKDLAVLN
jgi:hypothetical protein